MIHIPIAIRAAAFTLRHKHKIMFAYQLSLMLCFVWLYPHLSGIGDRFCFYIALCFELLATIGHTFKALYPLTAGDLLEDARAVAQKDYTAYEEEEESADIDNVLKTLSECPEENDKQDL